MATNCIRALEALAFVSLARNLTCVLGRVISNYGHSDLITTLVIETHDPLNLKPLRIPYRSL